MLVTPTCLCCKDCKISERASPIDTRYCCWSPAVAIQYYHPKGYHIRFRRCYFVGARPPFEADQPVDPVLLCCSKPGVIPAPLFCRFFSFFAHRTAKFRLALSRAYRILGVTYDHKHCTESSVRLALCAIQASPEYRSPCKHTRRQL